MKKISLLLFLLIIVISCSDKEKEANKQKIKEEIDERENSEIFSTKELVENGIDLPSFYNSDKESVKGNCKLKYTNDKVSYIFTLSAGIENQYDIDKHDFYKKYKNNMRVIFYDWDGFVINGPDIKFKDTKVVLENGYYVLRANGFLQITENEYYRIAGPFGDLEFY